MFNVSLSKASFLGAAIGTLVEYYDYALFVIFLPIIAPLFFPGATAYQALVNSYYMISIAAIARPLGGIFFGYIGDVIGRPKALITSMYGIALGTLLIGMTPSYLNIGIYATIIITAAKVLQTFCYGGEYNGAGIYVVEHAQNQHEILAGSLLSATTILGSLLAALLGILFTLPNMPPWIWRIAFILGALMGIAGIYFRKNMRETPNFHPANLKEHNFISMIRHYPKEMLAGIFTGGLSGLISGTILIFINPVLVAKGYMTNHQLMIIQGIIFTITFFELILMGLLVNTKSTATIMQLGALLIAISAVPLLFMIDHGTLNWIVPAEILLTLLSGFFFFPTNAYLKNLFSMQYRYRGSSLSFCLGLSIFSGLTPLIDHSLYSLTGHLSSAGIWLMLVSVGTYYAIGLVNFK